MDSRDEAEQVVRALIKMMGTQTAVAKILRVSKQTFNYWLNHAKKIPYDQLILMKSLLNKNVSSTLQVKLSDGIYHDDGLLKVQEKLKLPLCTALVALTLFCDMDGKFNWNPDQLKNRIFPFVNIDFYKILDALKQYGFIQKNNIGNQCYGHIPLIKKYVHEVTRAKMVI